MVPAAPVAQHKGASERRAWSPTAFQGRFAPIPAEPQPRCPGALEAPAEPQQCSGPSPADLGLSKASPHPGRAPAQGQAGKALGAPLTVSIPCFQRAGMAA